MELKQTKLDRSDSRSGSALIMVVVLTVLLAVIGVLIEEGSEHQGFVGIFRYVPPERGKVVHFEDVTVDIDALLPESESTYRYFGSLTTPPCSEGVVWIVFTDPIEASAEQIASMTELVAPNNRPVQPRNDRDLGLAP